MTDAPVSGHTDVSIEHHTEWVNRCEHLQSEVSRLSAENERLSAELSREERGHGDTIDQREDAEETVSQMYYLVTGRSPEWSNLFGHNHAIEDVDDAQAALRQEIAALRATVETLRSPLLWLTDGMTPKILAEQGVVTLRHTLEVMIDKSKAALKAAEGRE